MTDPVDEYAVQFLKDEGLVVERLQEPLVYVSKPEKKGKEMTSHCFGDS
jgi:hypothetical protein